MWVKRTDEEILAGQAKAKRLRLYGAIAMGVAVCVLLAFFRGKGWSFHYGSPYVPLEDVPNRLPLAAIFGFLFGWFFYHFPRRRKTVICPKCEKTKFEDSQLDCSCGGHFENIETMKWV